MTVEIEVDIMNCSEKKTGERPGMEEIERCVLCGNETGVARSTPVDLRPDYVEGAGQLCHACAIRLGNEEREAWEHGFRYTLPVYRRENSGRVLEDCPEIGQHE